MEQARSFKLLLQAELRLLYLRAEVLVPLYTQVAEFVAEEERLGWSVYHDSGLLGSVVEMAVS